MASAQSSWSERTHVGLTAATLVAAMVLGGGQGTAGDTLAQVLALGLLACLLVRARRGELPSMPGWAWLPVVAVVALPLLQLLPLPAGLWKSLDGRAELAAQLQAAGVADAAMRWSLDPTATEQALAWLLPGVALYLSTLHLPRADQGRWIALVLALAAAGALLGLAQFAGGPESPLRFYRNTNPTVPVGFFANRNHFACLLAMCLPLVIAWSATPDERGDRGDRGLLWLRHVAGVGVGLLLLLTLALTQSRFGALLAMLALAVSLPLLWTLAPRRGVRRVAAVTVVVASLLIGQFALYGLQRKFAADPLDDMRLTVAANTLDAARHYGPMGSGLGTFRQAYPPFDLVRPRQSYTTIVNHAHDDYLELWLETGWWLLPAALAFFAGVGIAASRALRASRDPRRRLQAAALVVALAVPLLHSLADYPLRTSANLAVTGLVFGLLAARARRAPPTTALSPAGGQSDTSGD